MSLLDSTTDPMRTDWEPLTPKAFATKYPEFQALVSIEWAIRNRHTNGMVEEGALVETFCGTRTRCRIVPALMCQRFTGQRAIQPAADKVMEQLVATNERLAIMESRLFEVLDQLERRVT